MSEVEHKMKTYGEHRRPLNLQKIADLEAEVKRLNEALELQIHVTGSAAATIDARDAEIELLKDVGIKLVAAHSTKDKEIERLKSEYSALQKRCDSLWRVSEANQDE